MEYGIKGLQELGRPWFLVCTNYRMLAKCRGARLHRHYIFCKTI